MRLPHNLVAGPLFLFENTEQLIHALRGRVTAAQVAEIQALAQIGLPPVVSEEALAVMIGVNSGLVWSFIHRPRRHYRVFDIPKGQDVRTIIAPKVAIKTVQRWLAFHFDRQYQAPEHVYGFVQGKNHIQAAMAHAGATWAYSADIRRFFESTPELTIVDALRHLGYGIESSRLIAKLCCFTGFLTQGSPTSPVLSNVCFRTMDESLLQLSNKFGCKVTRYADDIVFSGTGQFNPELRAELHERLALTPWRLAPEKEHLQPVKGRIKIHGLLIKDEGVRLTKGYRNQLRAYAHILATRQTGAENYNKLSGHLEYARQVEGLTGSTAGISQISRQRLEEQRASARSSRLQKLRLNESVFAYLRRLIGV